MDILALQITTHDGDVIRVSRGEYITPDHFTFRPHLSDVETNWEMRSALGGNTVLSHSTLTISNPSGVWDDVANWAGKAELRRGDNALSFAALKPVMIGRTQIVGRSSDAITLALFDAQIESANQPQATILNTNQNNFGAVLPEAWGRCERFAFLQLDEDGKVWACAGDVTVNQVFVDNKLVTSGYTVSSNTVRTRITFSESQSNVAANVIGLGAVRVGSLLRALRTRTVPVLQGRPLAGTTNTITLDSLADRAKADIAGRTITLYRDDGTSEARVITAYDPVARLASVAPNWTAPTADDIYSVNVTVQIGGFTPVDLDNDSFDLMDSEFNYDIGLQVTGGESVLAVQDKLLSPLLLHMAPQRNGVNKLIRLRPADALPKRKITRIVGGVDVELLPVIWQVIVRYRPRGDTGEWRTVVVSNSTAKQRYPHAQSRTIDVPVNWVGAARRAGLHILNCFGQETEIDSMDVLHDLTDIDLGDVDQLHYHRHGLAGGKLGVVVLMTDASSVNRLGVWRVS